jgi:hypothetical protein
MQQYFPKDPEAWQKAVKDPSWWMWLFSRLIGECSNCMRWLLFLDGLSAAIVCWSMFADYGECSRIRRI